MQSLVADIVILSGAHAMGAVEGRGAMPFFDCAQRFALSSAQNDNGVA
jgi:hypothetical protein